MPLASTSMAAWQMAWLPSKAHRRRNGRTCDAWLVAEVERWSCGLAVRLSQGHVYGTRPL